MRRRTAPRPSWPKRCSSPRASRATPTTTRTRATRSSTTSSTVGSASRSRSSILMIEVGRRIGLGLHGVGMPGHFLVGVDDDPDVFVDPFHAGRVLDVDGCRGGLRRAAGPGRAVLGRATSRRPAPRAILLRMLNNLQQTYVRAELRRRGVGRAAPPPLRRAPAGRSAARPRRCSGRSAGSRRRRPRSTRSPRISTASNAAKVAAEAQALRAREN